MNAQVIFFNALLNAGVDHFCERRPFLDKLPGNDQDPDNFYRVIQVDIGFLIFGKTIEFDLSMLVFHQGTVYQHGNDNRK